MFHAPLLFSLEKFNCQDIENDQGAGVNISLDFQNSSPPRFRVLIEYLIKIRDFSNLLIAKCFNLEFDSKNYISFTSSIFTT